MTGQYISINTQVVSKARRSFTPMIWGTKLPKNLSHQAEAIKITGLS